jgi:hypothetical protein
MSNDQDDSSGYAVGYRKPPQSFRFKAGQSGNPKGRPKSARALDFAELVKLIGAEPVKGASGKKVSKLEAVLRAEIHAALKGDAGAARSIFNRAYKHGLTQAVVQKSFIEITDVQGEFGELFRAYHSQRDNGSKTSQGRQT